MASLIIDENLPKYLVSLLSKTFPSSKHVSEEQLLKAEDKDIWQLARDKDYSILTKDWDFKFMSVALGCPPKVVRLNCGNKTTRYISDFLKQKSQVIEEFLANNDDCYLEIE